jgi:hypothetical protein
MYNVMCLYLHPARHAPCADVRGYKVECNVFPTGAGGALKLCCLVLNPKS